MDRDDCSLGRFITPGTPPPCDHTKLCADQPGQLTTDGLIDAIASVAAQKGGFARLRAQLATEEDRAAAWLREAKAELYRRGLPRDEKG